MTYNLFLVAALFGLPFLLAPLFARARRFDRIRRIIQVAIRTEMPLLIISGVPNEYNEWIEDAITESILYDLSIAKHFPLIAATVTKLEMNRAQLHMSLSSLSREKVDHLEKSVRHELKMRNYLKND